MSFDPETGEIMYATLSGAFIVPERIWTCLEVPPYQTVTAVERAARAEAQEVLEYRLIQDLNREAGSS